MNRLLESLIEGKTSNQKGLIVGMDEAGRGPVLGPLVVGLVGVTPVQKKKLLDLGVDDSKKLTEKSRSRLAQEITSIVSAYKVLRVEATEINSLMEKYTLNEIEVFKFQNLLKEYCGSFEELQLDAADVNAERFGSQVSKACIGKYRVVSEHKGDAKFVAVGAASIIAKYVRDETIKILQEEMKNFDPTLPSFGKGYPSNAKQFLVEYYKKYHSFPKHARLKWKTIQNITTRIDRSTSLDNFF